MRAADFFPKVPALFEVSKPQWEKGYNELIYAMRRPLSAQNVRDVATWTGAPLAVGPPDLEAVHQVLGKIRWPDVRTLAGLRKIEGLSLPHATALLHFHNPSFPPFQAGAVQGMALLGKRVRRPEQLSLDNVRAYRRWMDAVASLKEQIPFRCVPESHYFHSWVLECSLAQLALENGKGFGSAPRLPEFRREEIDRLS